MRTYYYIYITILNTTAHHVTNIYTGWHGIYAMASARKLLLHICTRKSERKKNNKTKTDNNKKKEKSKVSHNDNQINTY